MKDIIKEIVAETATEVSKKPIDFLCEIISNWLRHRFRDTLNKDFVINAEEEAIKNEIVIRCRELAKAIPTDKLTNPNKQVTTAALDSMLFCTDNDLMREMFMNIMVSTMDSTRQKYTHPSFPHILKQLSPLDACLFSMIKPNKSYKITEQFTENSVKVDENKYVVLENSQEVKYPEDTPLSFTVLSMMGLIIISENGVSADQLPKSNGDVSIALILNNEQIRLSPLGVLFYKCCLGDE